MTELTPLRGRSRMKLLDLFCGAGGAGMSALPDSALHDLECGLVVDAELSGESASELAIAVPPAHLIHLRARQLRGGIPFPGVVGRNAARLLPHVFHVLGLGSQPKVHGIAARRVVALMHHHHPLRDGSVMQLPAHAMRLEVLPETSHLPVSGRTPRRLPFPAGARISRLDISPELHIERLSVSHG